MYNMRLRNYLPYYIQEFLKERSFQVKLGQQLSESRQQQNGVPQGSILSVTLFALKINSIALTVSNNPRFSSSLYVDDFQVSFRHSDLEEAQREMQQFLRQLEDWATYNGFKFSTTKIKALLFTAAQNFHFKQPMYINNSIIPYADTIKISRIDVGSKITVEATSFPNKDNVSGY